MGLEHSLKDILKESLYQHLISKLEGEHGSLLILEAGYGQETNKLIGEYVEEMGYRPRQVVCCTDYSSDMVGVREIEEPGSGNLDKAN